MISNYQKIIIPFKNKKGGKYKYFGKAYIIIEKETKNIVLNFAQLDENQIVYGATNGQDGKGYGIKKIPELYQLRLKSFEFNYPPKPKRSTKLKTSIKEINEQVLKHKLTIKSLDAFISGSNSSGGLKKPDADPIRWIIEKDSFIFQKYENNLVNKNDFEWKIFSLLSNLEGVQRNNKFPDELSIEYINQIEELDIKEIFNLNWMHIPYKEANYEDLWIPFDEAFASQNYEKFINPVVANAGVTLQSDNEWTGLNKIDYIFKCIERGNGKFLSKELRAVWRKTVDEDMKKRSYEKDFIKGLSKFQRAHIIENKDASKFLLKENIDWDKKENYIKDLFNENNYILLTSEVHSYWDSGNIYIDYNGEIRNINLPDDEFKILVSNGNNISKIYNNTLNSERIYLLEKWGKHN
ncbi:MAG: hypothetical protein TYPL_1960 [Candidatus Tyloplasma litorale]|nr:MAG: hypothetical protein TYPL_1960 [Mycoplasmatales bacterium]